MIEGVARSLLARPRIMPGNRGAIGTLAGSWRRIGDDENQRL